MPWNASSPSVTPDKITSTLVATASPLNATVPTSFPSTSWSVAVADHDSDGVEALAADAVTKVTATAHVAVASR